MSTSFSLVSVFFSSFIFLFVCRKLAKKVGLVDKPNERKLHVGQVPLIGGIAIYLATMFNICLVVDVDSSAMLYMICSTVLIVLGVLDDRFDLSFKTRLMVQTVISLAMILIGYKSLYYLGFITGDEALVLPTFISYVVTILAVIGAINAFNMVDGIDGLLGGLASVTFAALGYMFYVAGHIELAQFCLLFMVAMLPYIMLNLGFPFGRRFKVFMGDAGSMFIGFTVIWLLIEASQDQQEAVIRPVTALWFIGLPLMDMVCIMSRRIKKGQSPFKPDREHLHHICQRVGMSPRMSLLVICLIATLMAAVGVWAEYLEISETVMFVTFLLVFALYYLAISYVWRITAFMHRWFKFTRPT
ncbi:MULTISPECIES: UDP-N-acetylglucosamine--undecaprenyl-phosphate N-acetylglucosaminephosphotransferase [Shewanella]|uniref:UDP-N-acetylglucosamine--undecaprenyl-phosphate N-acetylglucosaminephosphotransferase n=1 Tax=Shewanella TaxID=22 RepID=UPI00059F898C|nr:MULTISPECIES: UDP-N-acetylglucosamine--undecaprenyl-phosphate N-acetylglucosaminephosphotransferase [Shewanella]KIO36134.1 UDP-phosphate N-acetylglucosaminyl 1-phosphate transferase [Shewanella sp. cp20]MCL2910875.1 UDP-N-acetylglucosamine--undecaprenyl-phosphate N-acetylglucosaminephosphotransferase [Shewanella aquimarina]